jgi:hypothetical protein
VDDDNGQVEVAAGAHHPERDLTSVGDEDAAHVS